MLETLLVIAALSMPGDIEDAMTVFDQLEAIVLSVDYHRMPLDAVLTDLGTQADVPVRADWDSLRRLGIAADDETTYAHARADVLTVLRGLEVSLGDEFERPIFEVHAGRIVLTTTEATGAMRLLDVYDVRDLLARHDLVRAMREQRPLLAPADSGEGAERIDAAAEREESGPVDSETLHIEAPSRTPGEELMLLLIEHVDPEAWIDYGGSLARIDERDGALLVTAAPSVHRRIRDALRRLRRVNPSQVSLRVRIIELPGETHRLLTQRHRDGSEFLLDSLREHRDAKAIWRSAAVVKVGASATLGTDSETRTVELTLAPSLDADTGLISIELDARLTADDERSGVRTVLSMPQGRNGAVVELPGEAPSGTIRLLLLELDRP